MLKHFIICVLALQVQSRPFHGLIWKKVAPFFSWPSPPSPQIQAFPQPSPLEGLLRLHQAKYAPFKRLLAQKAAYLHKPSLNFYRPPLTAAPFIPTPSIELTIVPASSYGPPGYQPPNSFNVSPTSVSPIPDTTTSESTPNSTSDSNASANELSSQPATEPTPTPTTIESSPSTKELSSSTSAKSTTELNPKIWYYSDQEEKGRRINNSYRRY